MSGHEAVCAATLAATIPVLNYHKPLNPARTKLFLRSCPSEAAINREYGFSILNVLFIFYVFVAVGLFRGAEDASEAPVASPLKPVWRKKIVLSVMITLLNHYVIT